jgi:hypothetical protein
MKNKKEIKMSKNTFISFPLFSKKKGAMEMSVGTIVVIVLLMTVLILGLVLVRTIFKGSVENINQIDQAVKSEINKLFAEDSNRKIIVYPPTRKIVIKKGEDSLGFGFSIRNILNKQEGFTYNVKAVEVDCPESMTLTQADELISLGKSRTDENAILLPPGTSMENPVFVRFNIPDNAPPCEVRYSLQTFYAGKTVYAPTTEIDLEIQSN